MQYRMLECVPMIVESQRDHGDIEQEEDNVQYEEDTTNGVEAREAVGDSVEHIGYAAGGHLRFLLSMFTLEVGAACSGERVVISYCHREPSPREMPDSLLEVQVVHMFDDLGPKPTDTVITPVAKMMRSSRRAWWSKVIVLCASLLCERIQMMVRR